jgi:hypothetical protein
MPSTTATLAIVARGLCEPMVGKMHVELMQLADTCRSFQLLYYRLLAQWPCRRRSSTRQSNSRERTYFKRLSDIVDDYGVEDDALTGMLQILLDEWSMQM